LILPVFPKKWQNGFIRYLAGKVPENRAELRGKAIQNPPVFFFDDTLLGKRKRDLRPFRIDFNENILEETFSDIIGKRNALLTALAESKRCAGGGLRIVSATSLKEEAMEERAAGELYRRSRGAEIGRGVHEVLAEIDLKRPDLMGTEAMRRSIEMKYPGISSEVCSLVEKALRSDTVKDAARSRHCMREVPFSIHLDGSILEGSIDMIFEKDGEFIAVDYKTDNVKEAEAIEERMKKYEIQAAIYSYAFSIIHGIEPKEIRFIFLNAEKEKKIVIGPGIIERGKSLALNDTMQIAFET
jgi:hypothetical protein